MSKVDIKDKKIVVIGGCGHVGLPLGVTFALAGAQTQLVDIDKDAVETVNSGKFPFLDEGGDEKLQKALGQGLRATSDTSVCADADVFVFVIGTPVDEHLNPKLSDVVSIFSHYEEYFKPGCLVIMRSTLYPGTMEHLWKRVSQKRPDVMMAFCPERVAQGYALEEIRDLPQVVSAFNDNSFQAAYELFASISPEVLRLTPLEAEISKLMANAWRYLEFAIANQFYMIAEKNGVDFFRIYDSITYNYPRAKGYKGPGFAAGPCLFKDTMQLASYFDHQFYLGHSAMLVNEGLSTFAVERMEAELGDSLWGKTVGILGMAFKADNDDIRESLSYRVKKGLEFQGAKVLYHDPYVAGGVSLEDLLEQSDGIILGTMHSDYRDLKIEKPLVDVWGMYRTPTVETLPGRSS